MTKITLIVICFAFQTHNGIGQSNFEGIKWTKGLTWAQIKVKAKEENKYIFLNCYATWCGPCKVMDQQVFPDEQVAGYLNDKFISVKVQMDKTEKDSDSIKRSYSEAEAIGKKYHVDAYPSFMFFSPDGTIVDKQIGGMQKDNFIKMIKAVLVPGKVYNDPYEKYYQLKDLYVKSIKNYEDMPYMIQMAYKAKEDSFGKALLNEHTDYVSKLAADHRYTKENIELWAGFVLNSNGQRFRFFYNDAAKIDKVMKEKGYAAKVIDRSIKNEIIIPFLKQQASESISMTGLEIGGPGATRLKQNFSECDWKKLKKILRQRFDLTCTKRNLLAAKIDWYKRHRNHRAYIESYLIRLKKYTPELNKETGNINGFAWYVFLHITDKNIIDNVIPWTKKALEIDSNFPDLIDSYANLLYKVGKKNEAIIWQEKAIRLAPADLGLKDVLEKMKNNEPTHLKSGAIWDGISFGENR